MRNYLTLRANESKIEMEAFTKQQAQVPHNYHLGPVYRFFCWCSGARLYLLKGCPTDYNKFFGIGIIVFLTGLMASITGFYALYIIFNSLPLAIIFGFFWGILIFFLDWYIVSSLKKEERFFSEFLFSLPRLILAVLLAVVISRPLELKLFEKEIDGVLQIIQSENSIEYKQLIDNEFESIQKLTAENEKLKEEIRKKEELRDKLFSMTIEEAEGRSPTSKMGKGTVYREKKAEYDKIDKELSELKSLNNAQIKKNLETLAVLESGRQEQVDRSSLKIKQADGLLARMEAMSVLSGKNQTVMYASWFIFILFILIESSPILVKLLSKRGPYDELIDKEEYEKQIEYKKQKIKAKVLANNYLELLKQKDELQIGAEKRNNEKLVKEIEEAKNEINKLAIGKWKKQEIDAIEQEIALEENKNDIEDNFEGDILPASEGFKVEQNQSENIKADIEENTPLSENRNMKL
jgi:hypothetical protein